MKNLFKLVGPKGGTFEVTEDDSGFISHPKTIKSSVAPSVSDTYPAGTRWLDSTTGTFYETTGGGNWSAGGGGAASSDALPHTDYRSSGTTAAALSRSGFIVPLSAFYSEVSGGLWDAPIVSAIAAAKAENLPLLIDGIFSVSAPVDFSGIDVIGYGPWESQLQWNDVTETTLCSIVHSSGTDDRRSYRNFQLVVSGVSTVTTLLDITARRCVFDQIRVSGSCGTQIQNSGWLNSFRDCLSFSNADGSTVGLRLKDGSNGVVVIGGEWASDQSMLIEGGYGITAWSTWEGNGGHADQGKGVKITGGGNITISGYFEDKGIEINGGIGVNIFNVNISNNVSPIIVSGGKGIVLDQIWSRGEFPRRVVRIGSGLSGEVETRRLHTDDGVYANKCLTTLSPVRAQSAGKNLIYNGDFQQWINSATVAYHKVQSVNGGSYARESTTVLTGEFSMRVNSAGTGTSSQGILFDLDAYIDRLTKKTLTAGCWVFLPSTATNKSCRMEARVNNSVVASSHTLSGDCWNDAWAFLSVSWEVSSSAAATDIQIQAKTSGFTADGTDYVIIDRLMVVEGKRPINEPFEASQDVLDSVVVESLPASNDYHVGQRIVLRDATGVAADKYYVLLRDAGASTYTWTQVV